MNKEDIIITLLSLNLAAVLFRDRVEAFFANAAEARSENRLHAVANKIRSEQRWVYQEESGRASDPMSGDKLDELLSYKILPKDVLVRQVNAQTWQSANTIGDFKARR